MLKSAFSYRIICENVFSFSDDSSSCNLPTKKDCGSFTHDGIFLSEKVFN